MAPNRPTCVTKKEKTLTVTISENTTSQKALAEVERLTKEKKKATKAAQEAQQELDSMDLDNDNNTSDQLNPLLFDEEAVFKLDLNMWSFEGRVLACKRAGYGRTVLVARDPKRYCKRCVINIDTCMIQQRKKTLQCIIG